MKEYYWDNSATTRIADTAAQAMMQVLNEDYGNPSSLHRKGVEAERILKEARQVVARSLKAKEKEIIFTSGGTEADNLALIGLYNGNKRRGKHIVSSQIEHPAVLKALEYLSTQGADITLVKPAPDGTIRNEDVLSAIRPDTLLVSVMMVNNETGARMDLVNLARDIKRVRKDILFHTDAVQAYGKLPISLAELPADALSLSGHKLHGPKGVGALFLRDGVKCVPILYGGSQESGMRAGTENLPGIAGLSAAVKESVATSTVEQLADLQKRFLSGLKSRNVSFELNGSVAGIVPYIVNISFPGVLSEVLLHALESKGIYVSSGSACSSKKKAYSPVLTAMDLPESRLESALRFSFSRLNLEDDLEKGLDLLAETVREISQIMNRRETWKR